MTAITFALVFGGALFGVFLSTRLPKNHLAAETKDAVRVAMAMVGTVSAMVLGLLVGSAKTYYDHQRDELTQLSANVAVLTRLLQHYGPEANPAREALRAVVGRTLADAWPQEPTENSQLLPTNPPIAELYDQVNSLAPKNDEQRAMQNEAASLLLSVGQLRWLILEQTSQTASSPLLFVLVFWLTSIFVSWGMYSPRNATVIITFFIAAMAVSGAILMIMELHSPFTGLVPVSSAPLRLAYTAMQ